MKCCVTSRNIKDSLGCMSKYTISSYYRMIRQKHHLTKLTIYDIINNLLLKFTWPYDRIRLLSDRSLINGNTKQPLKNNSGVLWKLCRAKDVMDYAAARFQSPGKNCGISQERSDPCLQKSVLSWKPNRAISEPASSTIWLRTNAASIK